MTQARSQPQSVQKHVRLTASLTLLCSDAGHRVDFDNIRVPSRPPRHRSPLCYRLQLYAAKMLKSLGLVHSYFVSLDGVGWSVSQDNMLHIALFSQV